MSQAAKNYGPMHILNYFLIIKYNKRSLIHKN